jgi:NADP-dependent 3-hydroxy acid dehydrogenase YdfG
MGKSIFFPDINDEILRIIAIQAAEEGHQIIFNSFLLEKPVELVDEMKKVDANYSEVNFNPFSEESIKNMVSNITNNIGKIDTIITNFYVQDVLSFDQASEQEIKNSFDQMLFKHYLYYRIFVKLFDGQKEGDLVQLMQIPFEDEYAENVYYYSLLKGLQGFLEAIEKKYFQLNVRLMKIYYQKIMQDKFFTDGDTISVNDYKPEDIAQVVLNAIMIHKRSVISDIYVKTSRRHL